MTNPRCLVCESPLSVRDREGRCTADCPRCKTSRPVPDLRLSERGGRRPFLLLAAWLSPVIPLIAVAFALGAGPGLGLAVMGWVLAACILGGLSGLVGLFGVSANGAWATVPACLLGWLLNGAIGSLALFVLGISSIPRC